jgi:hypothetical protein
MKYTLFAGCSYTAGAGFELEKNEPNLWANQLYHKYFSHTTQLNVSRGGRSNAGIFQDTIKALLTYPVEYAIVEWTSVPRYELELGFETYPTRQCFVPNTQCRDHLLNDINYTGAYLTSISERFTALAHDCYEISNLIDYVNTIVNLSQLTKTKVFFINGLCPWDYNFFNKKESVLPSEYTAYTQKILNTSSRDDFEVFQLYNTMHDNFMNLGGIHESLWLNLYSSMLANKIDVNNDNVHPGIKSNDLYFELFSELLTNQLL